ncbi:tandem-95 repeat protein [bacterium]|nr:MAG: tandem-95 repeat protein [bacterium]
MPHFPPLHRRIALLTCLLAGASFIQSQANAATFTVTNTSDAATVDGVCSAAGTGDGCTLREAITAANNTEGADIIAFNSSVSRNISLNGTALPTINSDITINGPSARALTIQGKGQTQSRLLTINSGTVAVSGLTFSSAIGSSNIYNNSTLTFSYCNVTSSSGQMGGGIYNDNNGQLSVTNSTFTGNSASSGGGAIYNAGTLTSRNNTFSANKALNGDGAAIKNDGSLTVDSCTISANQAKRGGGLFNTGTLALFNTIVSGNAGSETAPEVYGVVNSGDYNLLSGTYSGTLPGTHNILGQDPKLVSSVDAGGPTSTYALAANSPAIDAGGTTLTIDQRGYTRPHGTAPDIGAFEFIPSPTNTNFIVTTTDDHDDGSCSVSDCTLREAISATNTNGNPATTDTITFADNVRGTINLSEVRDGGVYSLNSFILSERVSIQGPGADLLTVRRNTGGNYRLFLIKSGVSASLSGLTLSNGSSPFRGTVLENGPDTQTYGGGIYNLGALTIANCSLRDNAAKLNGGAIFNGGTLVVQGCTFSANGSSMGAAINNSYGANLTLQSSTLSNNTATQGSVLYNQGTGVVQQSIISGNANSGGWGCIDNASSLLIQNSTISGNGNVGISSIFATLQIINSTISGNGSCGVQTSGDSTISSCTITNNGVNGQGNVSGIYRVSALGTLTISNTIVAGNQNPQFTPDVVGTFASNGYNLIGNVGAATGFTATGDKVGRAASPLNPQLAPLASNGGTTQTHALLSDSPALDAGSSTGNDQRGIVRPIDFVSISNPAGGNGSDIGAFEAGASSAAGLKLTATPNPVTVGTALNLIVRAVDANGYPAEEYRGTVHFTSTDANSALPPDYTFTASDAGVHTFTITLNTMGTQSVSATDEISSFTQTTSVLVTEKPALRVTTTSDTSTNIDGQTSLREAISYANTLSGSQTIDFNAEIGGQTITLNGTQLPAITGTLNLVTPAEGLTLDGDKKSRILTVNERANLTLSDIALNNGNGSLGAGLHNEGTVSLTRCSFSGNVGNTSPVSGGGLFSSGTATIVDCNFNNNTCILGGGLYNQNGGTMTCTRITANSNSGNNGAGLANYGTLTVTDSSFSGNTSNFGSAIFNANKITLKKSILSNNIGSAFYNSGEATADQCTLDNNNGGGVSNSATLTMTNSTVSNNAGSGISTANLATISNCTIAGNTSTSGGGIFINLTPGVVTTVTNCTIVGNSAPIGKGGSIFNAGLLSISNTLLSAASGSENLVNVPSNFGQVSSGIVTSKGYNLSSDDASAYLNQSSDQNSINPQLGALSDNGGPTRTVALLPGSPALNAGDPAIQANVNQFDQRGQGFSRVRDGRMDIGAFEVQNDAPSMESVTLDNASPKTNDTLIAQVQATDPDGETLSYSYQWTKNGEALSGEKTSKLDLSKAGNGDRGDTIIAIVTVTDSYHSVAQSSAPATVGNSAPLLSNVAIAPSSPTTNDTLSFSIGEVTDADGDTPTSTYQWKKNGELLEGETASTLALSKAGNGDQNDKISVVVTIDDGHGGTASKESAAVTIGGSAPSGLTLSSANVAENITKGTPVGTFATTDSDGGTAYIYALVAGEGDSDNSSFTIHGNSLLTNRIFDFESKSTYLIRVQSRDGDGHTIEASFTISVTDVNEAPSAKVTLSPSTPTTNALLQATVTGSDTDGDTLTYSYQWKKGDTILASEKASTLNLSKVGNGDKGDKISVLVTPNDGNLAGSVATATVTIANSIPTMAAKTFAGRESLKLSGTIVGQDADKETLTYSLVKAPRSGSLQLQTNGSFTYTPKANWNGSDSFQARVTDGSRASAIAVFTLNIGATNGIPVAVADVVKGVEDVPLAIPAATLLKNDSNGEAAGEVDVIKIVKVTQPSGFPGTLKLDVVKQTILFTPRLNWNGTTSFTYTIQDSGKATATAQVTLQIAPVNDAPIAQSGRLSVISGTIGELVLSGTDAEGDVLTFALGTKPANGTAQVVKVADKWLLRYQSKVGFGGTDTVAIIARDGKLNSAPAITTVTVTPNAAPLLLGLTPNRGTFPASSTVVFEQKVRDTNGTAHLDATALLIGNFPTVANARGGATLWFDALENRFTLTKDDGGSTSTPVSLGGTLENNQVKVTLATGDVTRDKYGVLTLRWRVTFKPAFIGTKSLWMRVEDLGCLSAGFTKSGDITLAAPAKEAPTSASAGSS